MHGRNPSNSQISNLFFADSIYIRATELVIELGNYTCYCCCCFGMEIQAEHIFMEKHTQEKLYFATAGRQSK